MSPIANLNFSTMNTESLTSLAFIAKRNSDIASLQTCLDALGTISTWGGHTEIVEALLDELEKATQEREEVYQMIQLSGAIINLTDAQSAMLKDIQEGENDGIGMGYSEFDGIGLTPEEKGVLGSLVAGGYVYNSHVFEPDMEAMYCSTMKAPRLIDESMHDYTIK